MRTLRLTLVGTVIFVLLGSWATAVLAQTTEEEGREPAPASHFTGTWSEIFFMLPLEQWEWTLGPGYVESFGNKTVLDFKADDPRISGTWTQFTNFRSFAVDMEEESWAPVASGAVRIENEDGAWAGTVDSFAFAEVSGPEWYHLQGEGAYEGLTAVFRWIPDDDVYEGVIVSGVTPEYPAPIAWSMIDETAAESATEQPEADQRLPAVSGQVKKIRDAVYVTGTSTFISAEHGRASTVPDVSYSERGAVAVAEHEMSDPRVSGTATMTTLNVERDEATSNASIWGTMRVENDGGAWEGPHSGVNRDGTFIATGWLAGDDDYAGLTYYLHSAGTDTGTRVEEGMIYGGSPPPFAATAEPSAE